VHLAVLVDSRQLVNNALDRPQHRIEKRLLAIEYVGHEDAERLRDRENHYEEEQNL
jgi:hypothetical protein